MIIYNRTEYKALSTRQYSKEKKRLQVELLKLEEWVIKNNKRVGIVLEGRDAAPRGEAAGVGFGAAPGRRALRRARARRRRRAAGRDRVPGDAAASRPGLR